MVKVTMPMLPDPDYERLSHEYFVVSFLSDSDREKFELKFENYSLYDSLLGGRYELVKPPSGMRFSTLEKNISKARKGRKSNMFHMRLYSFDTHKRGTLADQLDEFINSHGKEILAPDLLAPERLLAQMRGPQFQEPNANQPQANDDQQIEAGDDQQIEAGDNQQIGAGDNQQVEAGDNQQIEAGDNQQIEAGDNQQNEAYHNSQLQARDAHQDQMIIEEAEEYEEYEEHKEAAMIPQEESTLSLPFGPMNASEFLAPSVSNRSIGGFSAVVARRSTNHSVMGGSFDDILRSLNQGGNGNIGSG